MLVLAAADTWPLEELETDDFPEAGTRPRNKDWNPRSQLSPSGLFTGRGSRVWTTALITGCRGHNCSTMWGTKMVPPPAQPQPGTFASICSPGSHSFNHFIHLSHIGAGDDLIARNNRQLFPFIAHSLCAKHFRQIISFNPCNNPLR